MIDRHSMNVVRFMNSMEQGGNADVDLVARFQSPQLVHVQPAMRGASLPHGQKGRFVWRSAKLKARSRHSRQGRREWLHLGRLLRGHDEGLPTVLRENVCRSPQIWEHPSHGPHMRRSFSGFRFPIVQLASVPERLARVRGCAAWRCLFECLQSSDRKEAIQGFQSPAYCRRELP